MAREGATGAGQAAQASRLRTSTHPAARLRGEHPDHVWALDFQFDQTDDGRVLELLNVVDEYTRSALAIVVARRIDSDATVATLECLVLARGRAPRYVRMDNGPELTAFAVADWCRFAGTGTGYIEPGSPWENPYVESFGGRLRDQVLSVERFDTLLEAQVVIEDWCIDDKDHRPHSSLGWETPAVYASSCPILDHPRLS